MFHQGGVVVVWGMKPIVGDFAPEVRIVRLEDGFLRSVGLGVDLIRPMSWVVDQPWYLLRRHQDF